MSTPALAASSVVGQAPPTGLARAALTAPGFRWDSLAAPGATRARGRPGASAARGSQGLAAAAEDRSGAFTGRQVVVALAGAGLGGGRLVPVDSLVRAFRRQDDLVAYLEAGTLVEYLLERAGPAALERIWQRGPAAIPAEYGRPLAGLVPAWRAWLARTPRPARGRRGGPCRLT